MRYQYGKEVVKALIQSDSRSQHCQNQFEGQKRMVRSADFPVSTWSPCGFSIAASRKETIKVEFDKSPIVVYSAKESHAIYACPGTKKRSLGLKRHDFKNGGLVWRPNRLVLWMPMVSKESGRLCDPLIVDVNGKKSPIRASPKKNPFYYLAFFRGKIGNKDNSQVPVPFKPAVTNLISDGKFTYKFQHGGLGVPSIR